MRYRSSSFGSLDPIDYFSIYMRKDVEINQRRHRNADSIIRGREARSRHEPTRVPNLILSKVRPAGYSHP